MNLPPGDILCHCGDALSRNACILRNSGRAHYRARAALRDLNDWLGSTPHAARICIGGNHDACLQELGPEQARVLLSNALYLEDGGAWVQGLRIWGSPWSSGRSANRAFQAAEPQMPPAAEANVDVLLSHCYHAGLAAAARPLVYGSGHAHGEHGATIRADGRVEVNSSICDDVYRSVQLPIVVDMLAGSARGAASPAKSA